MSLIPTVDVPHRSTSNCAFKATKPQNDSPKKDHKNSPVNYLIGATILAGTIAAGIIYHNNNYKNSLKNVEDATAHFKKKFGIDADFTKCNDAEYIQAINNVLTSLKKMDCKLPKTIEFCSFKDNSINIARQKYSLSPYTVRPQSYAHADAGGHVFFNSEAPSISNIVNKVNSKNLGHFKSLSPNSKAVQEYIAAHEFGHINASTSVLNYGYKSKYGALPNNAVDNLLKNLTKYQNEMYAEVKPFNNSIEVIPDTFAKLIMNPNLEFSDKTMLLYDVMGGGAIPNKKFKGMSYEAYMKSLYTRWQEILV